MVAASTSIAMFLRSLGQIFGVAIGGAIIQSQISSQWPSIASEYHLDPHQAHMIQVMTSKSSATGLVNAIHTNMPNQVSWALRDTFGKALRIFYYVLIPFSGICFLCSLFMARVRLRPALHTPYGKQNYNSREYHEDEMQYISHHYNA